MINKYIVQPYESVSTISEKLNIPVIELQQANNVDLNNISPGQIINIPDNNNNYVFYQAQSGDTLSSISKKTNIPIDILTRMNGLNNADYLYVGQVLLIPKPGYKVYITNDVENINDIANKLNTNVGNLLRNNKNIFLSKEQLLFYE